MIVKMERKRTVKKLKRKVPQSLRCSCFPCAVAATTRILPRSPAAPLATSFCWTTNRARIAVATMRALLRPTKRKNMMVANRVTTSQNRCTCSNCYKKTVEEGVGHVQMLSQHLPASWPQPDAPSPYRLWSCCQPKPLQRRHRAGRRGGSILILQCCHRSRSRCQRSRQKKIHGQAATRCDSARKCSMKIGANAGLSTDLR